MKNQQTYTIEEHGGVVMIIDENGDVVKGLDAWNITPKKLNNAMNRIRKCYDLDFWDVVFIDKR